MDNIPLRLTCKPGATPISQEDAERFFGTDAIVKGERRFEITTNGPWQIIHTLRGLAVTVEWKQDHPAEHAHQVAITLHGDRNLIRPRESGYQLEGRVKIGGKTYRSFTTSQLFELPGGQLIDVAILHVCSNP